MTAFQLVIDAVYKGADAFRKAQGDFDKLDKGAQKSAGGMKQAFKAMAVGAGMVVGALGTIAVGARAAFAELERGAALITTRDNFDRLAQSIGTTADALRNDMTEATRGMISQAQLMAGAGELMALGLTRSHDQTVRMSRVIGELGWNMQHLILEMNNMSGMRLDQLGLEMDKVKAKAKEFEEAGMSAKDAYAEAMITLGEMKLDTIQISEAGVSLRQMQAAAEDAKDAFSVMFATQLTGNVKEMAGSTEVLGDNLVYAAEGAAKLAAAFTQPLINAATGTGQLQEIMKLRDEVEEMAWSFEQIFQARDTWLEVTLPGTTIEERTQAIADLNEQLARMSDLTMLNDLDSWADWAAGIETGTGEIEDATTALSEWTDEAKKAAIATAELGLALPLAEQQAAIWREAGQHIQDLLNEAAQAGIDAHDEAAREIAEAYEEAAQQATSAFMAALQPDAMPDFGNIDAMRQSAFDMAGAFGLSVDVLGNLGVQLGVIDEQTAEAAAKAALFELAFANLFNQLQSGAIDVPGFIGAFDEMIAELQSRSLVEIQFDLKMAQDPTHGDPAWLNVVEGRAPMSIPVELTPMQDALNTAIEMIDGIPDNQEKVITFEADTSPVDMAMEAIDGRELTVRVNFETSGTPSVDDWIPSDHRRATGGPVRGNSAYIVGETGPELFVPWSSGTIVPNASQMSAGGGSTTINANVNVNIKGDNLQPDKVGRATRSSLEQFFNDLRREGVHI